MLLPPPARLVAAALVAAAAPLTLHAQASDASPFEAGRWGIELSSEEDLGSVGFLRFLSPRGALLIAPGIIVGSGEISQTDPFGGPEETIDISTLGFDLRVGYRSYRPLGRGVVSHLGLGALGQMTTQEEEAPDGTTAESTTRSFGAYGELGGSYYFTPRFGLGASAVATFTVDRLEDDTFGDFAVEAWTFAMPQTRLIATIVF
ncbi:MAG TPA: hypothetical protein VFZ11_08475 [Gemmatimonadaceae bacterium]